jgi:homocysteine S-methyltransferase
VGVNCTAPRFIAPIVRSARAATDRPIVVYPNSGERYDAAAGRWAGEASCDDFAAAARAWHAAGARLIGGCCRTTPAHIRELAALARAGFNPSLTES